MNWHIKKSATEEYFNNGQWTENREEAERFEDTFAALASIFRHGLHAVEITLGCESRPAGKRALSIPVRLEASGRADVTREPVPSEYRPEIDG